MSLHDDGECPWCGVTEGICGNLVKLEKGENLKCWRFVNPVGIEAFEAQYGKHPPEEGDNDEQEEQE